ncbi:hypothetical protein TrRE_jg8719, partial [Triparma retinervis]
INNNDFKNNDLQAAANQSDYVSFNNHVLLTRSSEYFLSLVITYTLNVATELQKTLMGLDTDDQWFLTSLPEWDEGEEEGGTPPEAVSSSDLKILEAAASHPTRTSSSDLLFRSLTSIPTHRFAFLFGRAFPSGLGVDGHCVPHGSSAPPEGCEEELRFIIGKFSTYATTWITAYVRRCQNRENWGVGGGLTVPDRYYSLRVKANRFRKEYELRNGRRPGEGEVAAELGVGSGVVKRINLMGGIASIDQELGGEGGRFSYRERLAAGGVDDPQERFDGELFHEMFSRAMAKLSSSEAAVVRSRLGMEKDQGESTRSFDAVGRTYKEVCKDLGVEENAKNVGKVVKVFKSAVKKIVKEEGWNDFRGNE